MLYHAVRIKLVNFLAHNAALFKYSVFEYYNTLSTAQPILYTVDKFDISLLAGIRVSISTINNCWIMYSKEHCWKYKVINSQEQFGIYLDIFGSLMSRLLDRIIDTAQIDHCLWIPRSQSGKCK